MEKSKISKVRRFYYFLEAFFIKLIIHRWHKRNYERLNNGKMV